MEDTLCSSSACGLKFVATWSNFWGLVHSRAPASIPYQLEIDYIAFGHRRQINYIEVSALDILPR